MRELRPGDTWIFAGAVVKVGRSVSGAGLLNRLPPIAARITCLPCIGRWNMIGLDGAAVGGFGWEVVSLVDADGAGRARAFSKVVEDLRAVIAVARRRTA